MLIPPAALASLDEQLAGTPADRFRVASVPVELRPLDLLRAGSAAFAYAGYFATPSGMEIGGLGAAWQTVAPFGQDRFGALADEARRVGIASPHVRFLIGFSYAPDGAQRAEWDGFTPTSAVIPRVFATTDGTENRLTVVLAPGHSFGPVAETLVTLERPAKRAGSHAADHAIESRPAPAEYERIVAEAIEEIRAGTMNKAVLARSVVITSDITPEPFDLVSRLGEDYPECYVFGWQQGEGAFVGASPELLVAVEEGTVRSHPLAGSAPRGEGDEHDRAIGEKLMASSKDRIEHRLVVDDIADRLAPLVYELRVDRHPSLRKLTHVQHLSSELGGELRSPLSVIEVAGALHPTPAVGGSPGQEALMFIDKHEGLDRGWYAGGIGWMNASGEGEIAIALRCALLRANRAFLYAGAGIVVDSDPTSELDETRLKFRTMLQLLTEA